MKKLSFLLLLLIFGAQSALALTPSYSDVPSDAWYRGYVEQLRDNGIVDAGEFYRPADSLNRAELTKMIITTIDGLKNYTPPPNPTFDDVRPGEWYTNYIEAAATLGIVTGYSDSRGNLIGIFGPGNIVNRAAATKMLVEAFNLEMTEGGVKTYPDINESDWFYEYVLIAGQYGMVSGYDNGYFGPADPVTRAQIAKMVVLGAQAAGLMEVIKSEDKEAPEAVPEEEISEEETQEEAASKPVAVANTANIEEINVPAGNDEVFVAKYSFQASLEEFRIETVTVVNDITGDKLGDQPEGTPAVKNVILKFPDKNGLLVTKSQSLGSDGKVRFANLSFYAQRNTETFFEIYAELNKFSDIGESLSGEVFRLGLQDTGNDQNSYRAVGDVSGYVIGFDTSRLRISNANAALFTVRKSVPVFRMNELSQNMSNGENTLISFTIQADQAGSIGLARLVLEVGVFDASGADLSLSNFKFYRGSSYLNNVTIYDGTGMQDLGLGMGGSLVDGLSYIIITFDQEETIGAGNTNTYSLKAGVSNSDSSDSVNTRIAQGDEETPLSGLTSVNQPNTGKIYVNGNPTAGIFTGVNDFAQTLGTAHNVIWSDKSAKSHFYPTVSGGAITSDSGSADWTNGYQLDLTALEDQLIEK
ncbi:S-layer homology domain-containing protein [Candidatus Peregrinibacteria bacterium]|nr:S-layer homology domain-containing protein [Candidatus Peregrinibacteria bacterium]